MANYDNLKKAIKKIIYSNENQEITGNILQQVLLDILSTNSVEGKIFAGIANLNTNPGTPDSNVFYLASTPGFYVNFDNNELVKGEISILYNDANGNWLKENLIENFKPSHTNAYTDDFLAIDDFALDPSIKNLTGANRQNAIANALNAWLNNVMFENTENEIKKLGRCRLLCDGINLECYNYIISFGNKSGIQTISGPCDLTSDNKIIHTSLTYNQIYRTRENGNWNNWRKK